MCQILIHKKLRSRLLGLFLSLFMAHSSMGQIMLRIVLDPDQVTYRVYMVSAVSYSGNRAKISTSQITVSVPHGKGNDRFVPNTITSPIPGMRWAVTGRVDAPRENPDRDYLFFNFTNNSIPVVQFDIVAGREYQLFEFKRTGNCIGSAQLLDNATDEFRTPNSLGINVGNSLSILGAQGNVYKTNADAPPTLTISAAASSVCGGEMLRLKAIPSLPASAATGYTYQWFADDQLIGPVTPSSDFIYLAPTRSSAATVRLRVKMFIKGPTTCAGQFVAASQSIVIKPIPVATLRYSGLPCAILPVVVNADPVPGASYQWIREPAEVLGASGTSLTVAGSGSYAVRITLNGCVAVSKAQPILGQTQNERVTVQIPSVGQVLGGTPIRLQPVVNSGDSFSWSPGEGLSSTTIVHPIATPAETTTYTLTAWSRSGCPASDTVTVRIIPPLYIPNTFTPNHDGQNDTWVIQNTQHHSPSMVRVFNRWGVLIYQSDAYEKPWTGDVNGAEAEPGIYLYTIKTPFVQYEGRLVLLR